MIVTIVYIVNIVNCIVNDLSTCIVNSAIVKMFKNLIYFIGVQCMSVIQPGTILAPDISIPHHELLPQVCMEVPETECELVGYTECDSTKDSMPARDDKVMLIKFVIIEVVITTSQVVGEFFNEQDCATRPITVTEMKMQPECVDQTKVGANQLKSIEVNQSIRVSMLIVPANQLKIN